MIYLVRQCQTDWNLFKRCNGSTETFLNETGIGQAEKLNTELKNINFDFCFCSPMIRTRQTCETIYSGTISFDDRLTEMQCGEFEGREETAEMWKEFFAAAENGERGVEKISDFMKRNLSFCEEIDTECKGKNVLIVTHAANIRAIVYYYQNKPKDYDFGVTPINSGEFMTFENLA